LGRQEARHAHTGPCEPAADGRPGIPFAGAVEQNAYIDAALVGTTQSLRERLAGLVGLKDIGTQKNMMPGALDGFQHRWVGLLAVTQRGHGVTAGNIQSRYGVGYPRLHGKGRRNIQIGGVVAGDRSAPRSQAPRPHLDAIEAQHEVQDGPGDGKEQA